MPGDETVFTLTTEGERFFLCIIFQEGVSVIAISLGLKGHGQLTEAVEQGPQARPVALGLYFFLSAELFGELSGVTKKTYKSSDPRQHSLPWHHY
jgi:hypothetical protein